MKSISIESHGRSRLNCVWRCNMGFTKRRKPPSHIFAGEKVCIQATIPTQLLDAFASMQSCVIASGVVSTGFEITRRGMLSLFVSSSAICWAWAATVFSVWSPYRCWLPVANHSSNFLKSIVNSFSLGMSRPNGARCGSRGPADAPYSPSDAALGSVPDDTTLLFERNIRHLYDQGRLKRELHRRSRPLAGAHAFT